MSNKAARLILLPLVICFIIACFSLLTAKAINPNVTVNMNTTVPDAPTVMPVYQTAPLNGTEIQDIITKFGMQSAAVETDTPERIRLVSGDKHLIIFKPTGAFDYTDYSIVHSTETISVSTSTAVQTADQYLTDRGLKTAKTYLRGIGDSSREDNDGNMHIMEHILNYSEGLSDGSSTRTAQGPGSKMMVSIGKYGDVGMVMKNIPKLEPASTTGTISGNEAFDILRTRPKNWMPLPLDVDEITISTVTIDYYIPSTANGPVAVEPVYIFSGSVTDGVTTDDFFQVVPALPKTNIDELKRNMPIYGKRGGITYDDAGDAFVQFAAGSFNGKLEITIDTTDSPIYQPPDGLVAYSNVFDFNSDLPFTTTATINFSVKPGFDPSQANVYRWNGAGWDKIDTYRATDFDRNEVAVDIDHFSIYSLFGPPPIPTGFNKDYFVIFAALILLTGIRLLIKKPAGQVTFVLIILLLLQSTQLYKVAEADNQREMFASGVSKFTGKKGCDTAKLNDLANAVDNASSFYDELVNHKDPTRRFTGSMELGDKAASRQWMKGNRGRDQDYVEKVDIAFLETHGGSNSMTFNWNGKINDCKLGTGDIGLGNEAANDLDVISFLSCEVLKNSNTDKAKSRWKGAFAGIHQMLGYKTKVWDAANYGSYFATYMNGVNDELWVWDAWKKAGLLTQFSPEHAKKIKKVKAAMIFVKGPSVVYYARSDFLDGMPGRIQAMDNLNPTSNELEYEEFTVY